MWKLYEDFALFGEKFLSMCVSDFITIHPIAAETFHSKPHMSTSFILMETHSH